MSSIFSQSLKTRKLAQTQEEIVQGNPERDLTMAIEGLETSIQMGQEASRMRALKSAVEQYGLTAPIMAAVDHDGSMARAVGIADHKGLESMDESDRGMQAEILIASIDGFVDDVMGQEAHGWRERLHGADKGVHGRAAGIAAGGGAGAYLLSRIPGIIGEIRRGIRLKNYMGMSARELAGSHFARTMRHTAGRSLMTKGLGAVVAGVAAYAGVKGALWAADKFQSAKRVYGSVEDVKHVGEQYAHISGELIALLKLKAPRDVAGVEAFRAAVAQHAARLNEMGVPVSESGDTPADAHKNEHYDTPYKMVEVGGSGWNEHTAVEVADEFAKEVERASDAVTSAAENAERADAAVEEKYHENAEMHPVIESLHHRAIVAGKAARHLADLVRDTDAVFRDVGRFIKAPKEEGGEGGEHHEG